MNKQNPFKFIAVAATSLLIGTFLSPIITCGDSHSENPLQLKADGSDKLSPAQTQAVALEDAFQEVFDKASPSVVSIATERTVNVQQHPFAGDPFLIIFRTPRKTRTRRRQSNATKTNRFGIRYCSE